MDQVSLPMRIALLAVLAFAGLWLVALRPKPVDTAPPTPAAAAPAPAPGVTGAAKKADKAVAGANKATAKRETAAAKTSEPAPAPAKPAATKADPAPAAKQPAATPKRETATAAKRDENSKVKRVLADIADKKVVVLLFWDRSGAEDREVFRAVEQTDRHGGKVSVRAAPIKALGDYDEITAGLPISGSPSVVVIDRQKRASVISGLTVTGEIDAMTRRALARK